MTFASPSSGTKIKPQKILELLDDERPFSSNPAKCFYQQFIAVADRIGVKRGRILKNVLSSFCKVKESDRYPGLSDEIGPLESCDI